MAAEFRAAEQVCIAAANMAAVTSPFSPMGSMCVTMKVYAYFASVGDWPPNTAWFCWTRATQNTPGSTKRKTGRILRNPQNNGPSRAFLSSRAASTRCTIVWSQHQYQMPITG